MFKLYSSIVLILPIALTLIFATQADCQLVIDFDELKTGPEQFFDGYGASAETGSWQSQGVEFNTHQFGPGWSYSAVNDSTTPGFMNQWASITEQDFSMSGNYVLANGLLPNTAFLNLPEGQKPESLMVTNSTFAFLSMVNGDAFAKQFGGETGNDPDWFRVVFTGFDSRSTGGSSTGSVEFLLADFRFDDNQLDFIVDSWEFVDLTDLGDACSIGITLESSDVFKGTDFINTPAYVVIDELILSPKIVLGDVNGDEVVDLLDVGPFVVVLSQNGFQAEADINQDGNVDLLDVGPFVDIISK